MSRPCASTVSCSRTSIALTSSIVLGAARLEQSPWTMTSLVCGARRARPQGCVAMNELSSGTAARIAPALLTPVDHESPRDRGPRQRRFCRRSIAVRGRRTVMLNLTAVTTVLTATAGAAPAPYPPPLPPSTLRGLGDVVAFLGGKSTMAQSAGLGADYLMSVQVTTDDLNASRFVDVMGYPYGPRQPPMRVKGPNGQEIEVKTSWKGAFGGEFDLGTPPSERRWSFFGLVWHVGQDVNALLAAAEFAADPGSPRHAAWLAAAELGGGFILDKQVRAAEAPPESAGLLLAFEEKQKVVTMTTAVEGVSALFELGAALNNATWTDAGMRFARWMLANAPNPAAPGYYFDEYNYTSGVWGKDVTDGCAKAVPGHAAVGRPMVDDYVMWRAAKAAATQAERDAFAAAFNRSLSAELALEWPPMSGNWGCAKPSVPATGVLHPRTGYWNGYPFAVAAAEVRRVDPRWAAVARRTAQWYARAQRMDGGMFRDTYGTDLAGRNWDFETTTFGHCVSATCGFARLLVRLYRVTNDTTLLPPLASALRFALSNQFASEALADPRVRGAFVEQVNPMLGGSDASPYHIRDIATSFCVQALADLVEAS